MNQDKLYKEILSALKTEKRKKFELLVIVLLDIIVYTFALPMTAFGVLFVHKLAFIGMPILLCGFGLFLVQVMDLKESRKVLNKLVEKRKELFRINEQEVEVLEKILTNNKEQNIEDEKNKNLENQPIYEELIDTPQNNLNECDINSNIQITDTLETKSTVDILSQEEYLNSLERSIQVNSNDNLDSKNFNIKVEKEEPTVKMVSQEEYLDNLEKSIQVSSNDNLKKINIKVQKEIESKTTEQEIVEGLEQLKNNLLNDIESNLDKSKVLVIN